MIEVWYTECPTMVTEPPELIYRGHSEREARRSAAKALGKRNLRGLAQAPSELGTLYFAWPDDEAPSVEIRGGLTL